MPINTLFTSKYLSLLFLLPFEMFRSFPLRLVKILTLFGSLFPLQIVAFMPIFSAKFATFLAIFLPGKNSYNTMEKGRKSE